MTEMNWVLRVFLAALFSSTTLFAQFYVAPKAASVLPGVHRIVFLGDSITQAGDYVTDCQCWLLAKGFDVELLNLGLGSETASDLTPEENSGHLKAYGFGRPFVSERLERALTMTKPDLLFACYGMNDAGSLPSGATGTKRFAEAITRLREAAFRAGVKRVVICTPPVHDDFENLNGWRCPAGRAHNESRRYRNRNKRPPGQGFHCSGSRNGRIQH
jgi:lysophospholipase L1-like esterase